MVAEWDLEGNLVMWSSEQTAFMIRDSLAEALNMPRNKIRFVVPEYVGGGFGGKYESADKIAPLVLRRRKNRSSVFLHVIGKVFDDHGLEQRRASAVLPRLGTVWLSSSSPWSSSSSSPNPGPSAGGIEGRMQPDPVTRKTASIKIQIVYTRFMSFSPDPQNEKVNVVTGPGVTIASGAC